MSKKLSSKVALVTGASRGIGAAIARRLAEDGAAVALTYAGSSGKAQEIVTAIEKSGGKALAIQADAGDEAATRNAFAKAVESFGALDILVNSAGALGIKIIEKYPYDEFEHMIAVNIKGMFVSAQEAARRMRNGGRIVLIGSCNSERVPFQGGSVYALTKAAVVGFTKGLARDLGPRGITVNNIQPGPTDTDMNPAHGPGAPGTVQHVALGRYAKPEEVANFVAFVVGPEASFISGASLLVDGGYAA